MTMNNRGILGPGGKLRAVKVSGFLLLTLLCLPHLYACSREDKSISSQAENSTQRLSGTLPVKIVPESPTAADDIQVMFAKNSGVSYAWEKDGVVLDGVTSSRLSRDPFSKHDTITVFVRKGNEKGSATVVIRNSLPKVTSVSLAPVDIHRGVDITAVPVAVDPDGDNVRFEGRWLLNGRELDTTSLVLAGDLFEKGDKISIEVLPLDDEGAGPLYKTKTITIPNAPPNFISLPQEKVEGGHYTYHAKAVDPDGDPLTFSLAASPVGMAINSATGTLTWQLPAGVTGTHQVEIVVRDNEGAQSTQKFSLNLTLNNRTAP